MLDQTIYPQLWFYDRMRRMAFPRGFVGKLMAICFVATHIPLIAFIIFLGIEAEWSNRSFQIAGLILLFATLAGTALALFSLHAMLAPLEVARVALANFRERSQLPHLPTDYPDAAGLLLREVNLTIVRLNDALAELAHEARVDPLTGIANRRALMERGYQLLKDAQRARQVFCGALIDVDHFKSINDNYGHGAGDNALMAVARSLSDRIGEEGAVGRLGGDEFCVLLPGIEMQQAQAMLEEIREQIAAADIGGLPKAAVRISIGLVQSRADQTTLQSLLSQADAQLYQAKEAGRDMVSAASAAKLDI